MKVNGFSPTYRFMFLLSSTWYTRPFNHQALAAATTRISKDAIVIPGNVTIFLILTSRKTTFQGNCMKVNNLCAPTYFVFLTKK